MDQTVSIYMSASAALTVDSGRLGPPAFQTSRSGAFPTTSAMRRRFLRT
jgi:hypothetical protein